MKHIYGLTFIIKIAIIYIFLTILAIIFYRYNITTLGAITEDELPNLLNGFLRFSTANICYSFGLYIAFSSFPFSYKFRNSKKHRIISYILYIAGILAITVLNLCDSVYFHYAAKRFTANEFFFIEDNSNNTLLVFTFLKDNILLIIAGLIIIALWTYLFIKLKGKNIKFRTTRTHYIVHAIVFIILVIFIIIGMRGGFDRQTRPITISNAAQYTSFPEKGALIISNPFCILRTIENKTPRAPEYFEKEELSTYFSTYRDYSDDSLSVMSQKGKNVIIFIMESFSAEHSKKLYPELYSNTLTPFIDSLMNEGYVLRKSYANGKKSIDALPSILSSIPSFENPFATLPEALSRTDGIGHLAKSNGYSTYFFNGSERGSMGYVAYSKISGIDNFKTKEDYEAVHGSNDYDGYWGIWDEPFFQFMAESLDSTEKPFFATIFTLTSHHPFVVPDIHKKNLPKGYTKIHRPVAYVDMALQHFFNYARTKSWYNNTLFVFVADHVSSEKYGPEAKTPVGSTHIMNFYYTPDNSIKGEFNNTTQQIDIMPSLVSLLDFKGGFHAFGKNIFSARDTDSFAINYTNGSYQWIQNDTVYMFENDSIVSIFDLKNDSLQMNNIYTKKESNNLMEKKIKSFIQTYYNEIKERKFSYRNSVK